MRLLLSSVFLIGILGSCSVEPAAIEYGYDHCNFCEMTVVDKGHAAVLVSTKGKSYKFDAIECMMRFVNRSEDMKFAHVLVCDYTKPGTMIKAEEAHFLISQEIPSPMGGFLSAIYDEQISKDLHAEKGGELFRWAEIETKFQ